MKTSKPRKAAVKTIPFCRVKVQSMFVHEGVKYMKFAPKKGITTDGKVINLADSTLVGV